jgi:hypothetical protein
VHHGIETGEILSTAKSESGRAFDEIRWRCAGIYEQQDFPVS